MDLQYIHEGHSCCWLLAAAGCWLLAAAGCCWLLAAAELPPLLLGCSGEDGIGDRAGGSVTSEGNKQTERLTCRSRCRTWRWRSSSCPIEMPWYLAGNFGFWARSSRCEGTNGRVSFRRSVATKEARSRRISRRSPPGCVVSRRPCKQRGAAHSTRKRPSARAHSPACLPARALDADLPVRPTGTSFSSLAV